MVQSKVISSAAVATLEEEYSAMIEKRRASKQFVIDCIMVENRNADAIGRILLVQCIAKMKSDVIIVFCF